MTLKEFNLVDEVTQAEVLLNHGVLIIERLYKQFRIMLYQLDAFYVEVYYHLHYSMIQGFRAFDNPALLDPYLELIDLTELETC